MNKFDTVKEVLDFLYNSRPHGQVKLGLERIEALLEELGNPQLGYKTIHVAGTNGKGSITRTLSTILTEHGLKTGANYSPHLVRLNERFTINNDEIENKDIIDVMNKIYPAVEKLDTISEEMKPSFFEIVTALAFQYFAEKKVDTAVFEVGMGGRFDATNVIKPSVSVISNIAFDHVKTLGDTLAKIAFEKSGIIKLFTPLVTGAEYPQAVEVILKEAEKKEAPASLLHRDFEYMNTNLEIDRNSFDYKDKNLNLEKLDLRINGVHQFKNSSVAIKAYSEFCIRENEKFNEKALRKALGEVFWAGRFEKISSDPVIIVDGAHNDQGSMQLVENWVKYFPGKKAVLLTGILSDKDYHSMVRNFAGIAKHVVVTEPVSPRETDISQIYDEFKKYFNKKDLFFYKDHFLACKKALERSSGEIPVLITGSLYLIGYLKEIMQKNFISSHTAF